MFMLHHFHGGSSNRRRVAGGIAATVALIGAAIALVIVPSRTNAQSPTERGAFVMLQRGDTMAIERFTRTTENLSVDLMVKMQGRFVYLASFGPNQVIAKMILSYYRPNVPADAPAAQTATFSMRPDSLVAEVGGGGGALVTQRFKAAPGAILSPPSSFAALEQVTRRARAAGGSADVPIVTTSGAINLIVHVQALGTDSMTAAIAGQEYRLRVDDHGRILGGAMATAQLVVARVDAAAAAKIALGKPDYAAPPDAPYTAEEITFKGPNGITLGGTLTRPKGATRPVPAIVTITGSGQQDRDEYIPVAGGYRPFRQIADTLGRRGIAVLRLDDRGVGLSGGEPATSTTADFADDIRAAVAWLRLRPDIDGARIGLVGHSEGGLIAPMVAATDAKLRGIVLLAGPSDNGYGIIKYQIRYGIDHDTSIAVVKRDSAFAAGVAVLDSTAANQPWLKYFFTYDPIVTARKVRVPALVLQGQNDRQITFEQAEKLGAALRASGNKDVTVRVFPAKNHLFIDDPDGSPSGYTRLPTNRIGGDVLGAIADWLAVRFAATPSS